MDLPDWASIILLLFFLLMSAFYSATETAFACLNKYKFQIEAEDGKTSSKLIVKLYEHFETTLITVLIGNNLFAVLISTVSTFLFLHLFHGILNDSVVSLIASIVMAIITFMFGDTIPKFVAKRAPNIVARVVAFPTAFFVILFFPISLVFRGFEWLTRKIFRAKPEADFTDEDFAQEIERKEKEGELEENESDIIVNSIDFGDTAIREVLTPISRMTMLNGEKLTTKAVIEFLKKCPYSRIPIYYQTPDRMIGVLVVKNFLAAYLHDPSVSYLPYVQKPYFVKPTVKIDDLIDGFRENHTQIALVRKDKKIIGMVTTEDVLEELVGNIGENTAPLQEGKK